MSDKLLEKLYGNAEIDGWSVAIITDRRLSTRVKESEFGGPYTPPSFSEYIDPDSRVLIKWRDGTISTGKIDSALLAGSESSIAKLKGMRYNDRFEPEILGPQPIPGIKTRDRDVEAAIDDPSAVYQHLFDVRSDVLEGSEKLEMLRDLTVSDIRVATSNGLDHEFRSTSDLFYLDINNELSEYVFKRRLIGCKDTDQIVSRLSYLAPYMKKHAAIKSGKMAVRLMPKLAREFIESFLTHTNLSGEAVADGKSAYSKGNFDNRDRKFRSDLTIYANPTVDFDAYSFPCSVEGVPSRLVDYVKNGVLITPMLDTKNAKRLGYRPTPIGDLRFGVGCEKFDLDGDSIVLVYDVLGMHTCDFSSGNFSLNVDKALLVKNGKIIGAPKISIAGNFLEALNSDSTIFYDLGEEIPAIEMEVSVTAH